MYIRIVRKQRDTFAGISRRRLFKVWREFQAVLAIP